ncbi:hypothetical protein IMSAG049_01037 [Clostridiales bacterium]|nr:hypothetical protein IMSAG049_01037 [Clostridiales bacterium]
MDKNEFLKELENRIRVLDKSEIKDILAEYSQHIEMRMDSGLSEEDAIRNFGDMDDLAAEILEAYHVNPEFEKKETVEDTKKNTKIKTWGTKIMSCAVVVPGGIKKVFGTVAKGLKRFFTSLLGLFSSLGNAVKKLFSKMSRSESKDNVLNTVDNATETVNEKKKMANKMALDKKVMGRCKKMISGLLFICMTIIVILCLIPVTIVGAFSIFGAGTLLVLLFQGYPVIGIWIICLGATIMSISLWFILISLLRKNKTEVCIAAADEEVETEELVITEEERQ